MKLSRSVLGCLKKLKPRLVVSDFDGVFTFTDTLPSLLSLAQSKWPLGEESTAARKRRFEEHLQWYFGSNDKVLSETMEQLMAHRSSLFESKEEETHGSVKSKTEGIRQLSALFSDIDSLEMESITRMNDNYDFLADIGSVDIQQLAEELRHSHVRPNSGRLLAWIASNSSLRVVSTNWSKELIHNCVAIDCVHLSDDNGAIADGNQSDELLLAKEHIASCDLVSMDDKSTGEIESGIVTCADKLTQTQQWRTQLVTDYGRVHGDGTDVVFIGDTEMDLCAAYACDTALWLTTDSNEAITDAIFGKGAHHLCSAQSSEEPMEVKVPGVCHFILCDHLCDKTD